MDRQIQREEADRMDQVFGQREERKSSVRSRSTTSRFADYDRLTVQIAAGGVIALLVALWCSGAYFSVEFILSIAPAIAGAWPILYAVQVVVTLIQVKLHPFRNRIWIIVCIWFVVAIFDISTSAFGSVPVVEMLLGASMAWLVAALYGITAALLPEPGIRAAWPIMTGRTRL